MLLDCDLSPIPKVQYVDDLPENFRTRIGYVSSTGCWVWVGNLTGNDSRAYVWHKGKTRIAARVIWELAYGKHPLSKCVLHTCDNPACVNPKHLYLGDQRQNAVDREVRGRNRGLTNIDGRGETNPMSKLTSIEVHQIRASKETQSILAQRYGVSRATIGLIRQRKLWKHLSEGGGTADFGL